VGQDAQVERKVPNVSELIQGIEREVGPVVGPPLVSSRRLSSTLAENSPELVSRDYGLGGLCSASWVARAQLPVESRWAW
jgi:hypothetical protein